MKFLNYFIAFSLFSLIASYNDFKKREIEIALEILKELKISHCVLVAENSGLNILNYKEIYNHNVLIAYVQSNFLKKFVYDSQLFYFKIGFVMKMNAVSVLQDLFEKASF